MKKLSTRKKITQYHKEPWVSFLVDHWRASNNQKKERKCVRWIPWRSREDASIVGGRWGVVSVINLETFFVNLSAQIKFNWRRHCFQRAPNYNFRSISNLTQLHSTGPMNSLVGEFESLAVGCPADSRLFIHLLLLLNVIKTIILLHIYNNSNVDTIKIINVQKFIFKNNYSYLIIK